MRPLGATLVPLCSLWGPSWGHLVFSETISDPFWALRWATSGLPSFLSDSVFGHHGAEVAPENNSEWRAVFSVCKDVRNKAQDGPGCASFFLFFLTGPAGQSVSQSVSQNKTKTKKTGPNIPDEDAAPPIWPAPVVTTECSSPASVLRTPCPLYTSPSPRD